MSHSQHFDEWEEPSRKAKTKKVKQRRRDAKRRFFDDTAELDYQNSKWR